MSTPQHCLLEGDTLAQYRFSLQALLQERLTIVREWPSDLDGVHQADLEETLRELAAIAAELRHVGPESTEVPF